MAARQPVIVDMESILRNHGGVLDLPSPSHPKRWGTSITKWLQRGLSAKFIEHMATNIENQEWDSSRRTRAKMLEWEFGIESHWRQRMEETVRDMKYSILFGNPNTPDWEASVIQCYEHGFSSSFVEELERRQKPDVPWTPTTRNRAKALEWEFHRPTLIMKYTAGAGKATKTIVREMLIEKGIKLSPETLNKRLSQWSVCKRTKPHTYSTIQEGDFPTPLSIEFAASRTINSTMTSQPHFPSQELPGTSSLQLANAKYEVSEGSTAELMDGVEYSAISSPEKSEIFASGDQNMPERWYDGHLALLENSATNGPCPSSFSYNDYACSDEIATRSTAMIGGNSDISTGFYRSPSIQKPPHPHALAPSQIHSVISMNATSHAKGTHDGNSSSYEQMTSPTHAEQLILARLSDDTETKIQGLNAAIKYKEGELIKIESNHSVIARELNELRNQLRYLSSDPPRFATSNGYQ